MDLKFKMRTNKMDQRSTKTSKKYKITKLNLSKKDCALKMSLNSKLL